MTYVSVNGTGTGEIALGVDAADGLPLGQLITAKGHIQSPITILY